LLKRFNKRVHFWNIYSFVYNWMTVLGLTPSKACTVDQGSKNGQQQTQHEMSEHAKKLAANALAGATNAAAVASG
jgi:hypothetical protein